MKDIPPGSRAFARELAQLHGIDPERVSEEIVPPGPGEHGVFSMLMLDGKPWNAPKWASFWCSRCGFFDGTDPVANAKHVAHFGPG